MTWEPINLSAAEFEVTPAPPDVCGVLYAGKRHVVSAPPESIKSVFAYLLAIEHARAGGSVAIVDFEMGPTSARALLDDLGATHEEIGAVMYFEPDTEPTDQDIALIVRAGVTLVILDAAAGAYDTSGLDDNARKDAEKFARAWIRPLWQQGVTTLVIDHVPKSAETRGKYAIGSERKLGQADVHLGLEVIGEPLHRGSSGHVKARVHKDRFGHLPRPYALDIHLQSDPETHRLTWTLKAPTALVPGVGFRPTFLMQRVSDYLEKHGPSSRTQIERAKLGKQATYVRDAIDALIADGYADETIGSRGARITTLLKPYNPTPSNSSDPVSPRPTGSVTTPSTSSAPYGQTGTETGTPDGDDLVRLEAVGDSLGLTMEASP